MRDVHPGVRLAMREGHQEELLTGLRRGEIDLAVTYDLEIGADIAFRALATLPPHVLLVVLDWQEVDVVHGSCQLSIHVA